MHSAQSSRDVRKSQTPQRALGRAIGLRRLELNLKLEDLADLAQLDKRTIQGIEAGTANPTSDSVDRIARALGWAHWELLKQADELETKDRQPTNQPIRRQR
jgi:transcriptional regulator with XRE-family HTH domain